MNFLLPNYILVKPLGLETCVEKKSDVPYLTLLVRILIFEEARVVKDFLDSIVLSEIRQMG